MTEFCPTLNARFSPLCYIVSWKFCLGRSSPEQSFTHLLQVPYNQFKFLILNSFTIDNIIADQSLFFMRTKRLIMNSMHFSFFLLSFLFFCLFIYLFFRRHSVNILIYKRKSTSSLYLVPICVVTLLTVSLNLPSCLWSKCR